MKILLTNDDGIHAPGLKKLNKNLKEFAEVIVVAPDRERSGSGCSASIYQTVRCQKIWSGKDFQGYALSGTPVDCIMIGLEMFTEKDKPDLIISGINAGANLGRDIFYSGTVGAAIEGAYHNIPSIAVSINQKEEPYYDTAVKVIGKIIQAIPLENFCQQQVLNINIPNVVYSAIKGIKLTKLARIFHQKNIQRIHYSEHAEYFWIEGSQPEGVMEENSDYWAICNNYISITSVSLELMQNPSYGYLDKWVHNLKI